MKPEYQPPKFISRWIERLTDLREAEVILGDMQEDYELKRAELGKFKADLNYIQAFASLLFHRVLKRKQRQSHTFRYMFANYIKIALRQMARQRTHNIINIAGLGLGLGVTLVISLFVARELSFNQFYPTADRVYLAPMVWKFGSSEVPVVQSTSAVGYVWKETYPEVEHYVRTQSKTITFVRGQEIIEERGLLYADSTYFDVFGLNLLIGNPRKALVEPRSLVLTEAAAVKYFGSEWRTGDILAQTLVAQNGKTYKITGVMRDLPSTTHIQFSVLASMSSLPPRELEPNWDSSSFETYLLLSPRADVRSMLGSLKERLKTKYGEKINSFVDLDLMPLNDVYLRNQKYLGLSRASDIKYVYIFSGIALLVLIIAVINYMNLSTARSLERAKEVGVRKSVGALRNELFFQFLSESMLVTFFAFVLAIGIVYLSLPLFAHITGNAIPTNTNRLSTWFILVAGWLGISLLGGVYPAFVLSSFKPAKVLKGRLGNHGSGAALRKGLVIFQFAISIFLIIDTLTINKQLQFMTLADVGIDKEKLISIPLDSIARRNKVTLRESFQNIPGVEAISFASSSPVNIGSKAKIYGGDLGSNEAIIYNLGVDPGFLTTSGLTLVAGSDLSPELPRDSTWEYLLNQSAVEHFGWTMEDAIGKRLDLWGTSGVVKGIVKDFHLTSLQKPIEPLLIHAGINNNSYTRRLIARVQGSNFESVTRAMYDRWKLIVPASSFNFSFVQSQYDEQYQSESRLGQVMSSFSFLAIVIAALGLFGLASYTISQRTKELGIRKVLGASLASLLLSVSGRFIVLVVVAFGLAAPLSWYTMRGWLASFAYSVPYDWSLAFLSGLAAAFLSVFTVLYHALEAARVNPAHTLRSE